MDDSAVEMWLYFYEFNGRLTFVTVGHVDDLFYAYDTRCETTKALLDAIVMEFKMSRKQYDFVFLWQTCSYHLRSVVHQSRVCGLISLANEIAWSSAFCRNRVDAHRAQSIAVCCGNFNGCSSNHVLIYHMK